MKNNLLTPDQQTELAVLAEAYTLEHPEAEGVFSRMQKYGEVGILRILQEAAGREIEFTDEPFVDDGSTYRFK